MIKLQPKYIKAFSQDKSEQLITAGYEFLFEQHGVYYFKNNSKLKENFSNQEILKDTKPSLTVNF
jgi:hypothetical protein